MPFVDALLAAILIIGVCLVIVALLAGWVLFMARRVENEILYIVLTLGPIFVLITLYLAWVLANG